MATAGNTTKHQHKLCVIGSGNWGCCIAKIIGENIQSKFSNDATSSSIGTFESRVNMWVFEEDIPIDENGKFIGDKEASKAVNNVKLTEYINDHHENPKYLPGISLPKNVTAVPDLLEAAKGSDILIFVLPHQFVGGVCEKLSGHVDRNVKIISLIKGIDVNGTGEHDRNCDTPRPKITLISDVIKTKLFPECGAKNSNVSAVDINVLMGANIAREVAQGFFCETTIGYTFANTGKLLRELFQTPSFRIKTQPDIPGVELCGGLKNIIGIAAGIVDGLQWGDNCKAAVIRAGLEEIRRFVGVYEWERVMGRYFDGERDLVHDSEHGFMSEEPPLPLPHHSQTFFESCGLADLITTCYGGRNRLCAEKHVLTGKSFEVLEAELLGGQKLQGTTSAFEVHQVLKDRKIEHYFPIFTAVYRIVYENAPPKQLFKNW